MSKRRSVDGCAKAHSPRSVPEGFGHLLYSVYIYTRNPSTRPWSLLLGPWVRVVAQETRVLNTDPMSSTPATHPTSFHANPQILTKRLPPPPPQVLPRSRRLQPPSCTPSPPPAPPIRYAPFPSACTCSPPSSCPPLPACLFVRKPVAHAKARDGQRAKISTYLLPMERP